MTKVEDLTEKLDELYEAFKHIDQVDTDQEEIQEIVNDIETYSSETAERIRSLETLNQKYEEVIPQMQRELESYRSTEADDIDREYLADLVLDLAEEYEKSTERLESLRNEHRENMSNEDPFDILYS